MFGQIQKAGFFFFAVKGNKKQTPQ